MPDASIDAVVTDPPYGLSFMGKKWDYDVPATEVWAECLRVLKPGGHLLAFAGTRTQHRMAVRIEDAGFEIRDMIAWVYGQGFPKSLDVGKAIDKSAGHAASSDGYIPNGKNNTHGKGWGGGRKTLLSAPATDAARQWHGWGTALKPAMEPITLARKPLVGTCAENVTEYGTGAINVDGCRVGTDGGGTSCTNRDDNGKCRGHKNAGRSTSGETFHGPNSSVGRWPANLIHDGSEEACGLFPVANGVVGARREGGDKSIFSGGGHKQAVKQRIVGGIKDSGSASRFFYCAKASKADREAGAPRNHHPTVKPTALMQYLCRLVTPPGGTVLDPFAGSGSTGRGAVLEGFNFIGIEREAEYVEIASARIAEADATYNERLVAHAS
jgi:site-specific DNA-methyltransferase (adenine-specific)